MGPLDRGHGLIGSLPMLRQTLDRMVPFRRPRRPPEEAADTPAEDGLALVLSGGGARAAYQVGLIRCLARRIPDLRVSILSGVSAGAINASVLAGHPGTFREAADRLTRLWSKLNTEDVFENRGLGFVRRAAGWGSRLLSAGRTSMPDVHGFLDSTPLRNLLWRELGASSDGEIPGLQRNLDEGRLKAVAILTLNYATGQTISWVQGNDVDGWEGTNRRSIVTPLTVDHVLASSSLPFAFPAVRLGRDWHGDGGVRLVSPLSPALHLGARRILAVSTRHVRTTEEEDRPNTVGYPPPAQILGLLMNAVFLDTLDEDVVRLEDMNRLLEKLPPEKWGGMRPVNILALRPSVDLGALAGEYEPKLPGFFRVVTRSLGSRETRSPDFLSLLMFQPDYLRALIDIGEADAEARVDEIVEVITAPVSPET